MISRIVPSAWAGVWPLCTRAAAKDVDPGPRGEDDRPHRRGADARDFKHLGRACALLILVALTARLRSKDQ